MCPTSGTIPSTPTTTVDDSNPALRFKDRKLWEFWCSPCYGQCRIYIINRATLTAPTTTTATPIDKTDRTGRQMYELVLLANYFFLELLPLILLGSWCSFELHCCAYTLLRCCLALSHESREIRLGRPNAYSCLPTNIVNR